MIARHHFGRQRSKQPLLSQPRHHHPIRNLNPRHSVKVRLARSRAND
jgi:hypothetical protein